MEIPSEAARINLVENNRSILFFTGNYFKMKDFKIGLEHFNLQSTEFSDQSENQVYILALNRVEKSNTIKKSIRSLSFNIGLVFVFLVYYALNTPILSL